VQTHGDCADYFIDEGEFDALADSLGDHPRTVICVHSLRRRLCKAFARCAPGCPENFVVQFHCSPSEPMAHGGDPELLFEVLGRVHGWASVSVDDRVAQALALLIEKHMGGTVKHCGDLYYVLRAPAADFRHHDVRELIPDDVALLEAAPLELRGCGFETSLELLEEGVVACGLVSGRVVAVAYTSAISGGYADIGVYTASAWRGRGFATACASMVAARAQNMGLTPVWSTSEDNPASIKIAEKVGFERVSRRTCLITGKQRRGA
jgi:GNAT superfamily N-acetyltransferase